MADYRAHDLTVLPFTEAVKGGPYQHARGECVKDSLEKIGVWDRSFTASQLIERMDAVGIDKALVKAHAADTWEVPFEVVSELAAAYPDRIYGLAGVKPSGDIMEGVRQLERGIRDHGFVGAMGYPHWHRLPPDDRAWYPFYAKCVELDVPLQLQAGLAFQNSRRSLGFPSAFDTVAVDFPELKLIGVHTGYPWERELVAVAWKNANVYIGADSVPASRWAPELVDYIKGDGREKVLFGTNYPCLDFAQGLAEVDELGLAAETRELLLRGNLERVYGFAG